MVNIAENVMVMLKNLLQLHLKLLQKEKLKYSGGTGDLIGNKIADKIKKVSKTLPDNNSETVTNANY